MTRVLLDTDILSEVLKQRDSKVVAHAEAYRKVHRHFTLSVITAMEIAAGLHRAGMDGEHARFLAMLEGCEVLPFGQDEALLTARIDGDLHRRGTPVNINDAMIAAIALRAGLPLVTGNTAHFEMIRTAGYQLRIENWRS